MYKLYYFPDNASLAPHFLLHYMNLPYELVLIDTDKNVHKSDDYLKLNPSGRIPTLIDNDQAIFESSAICIHLCEQHPEHNLIPKLGTKERPMFYQWLAYLNNTLQSETMVFHYAARHTNDARTIENVQAAQCDRIADALSIINDQLSGKQYLLGDQISVCDFYLFMLVGWVSMIEKSPLTFKYLAEYLKRMSSHATIQAVCKIEGIDLQPYILSSN